VKLYGIMAEKQSGKSTFVDFAQDLLPGLAVERAALAGPLKEFCIEYLGLSEEQCYGSDNEKNKVVGTWKIFSNDIGAKYRKGLNDPLTAREVMQVVGTEIFRAGMPNFWVDCLLKRTLPRKQKAGVDVVFVDDVRFINELEAIQAARGKVIRLYREVERAAGLPHPSELEMRSIADSQFDYVIPASKNTTMDVLRDSVQEFLAAEKLL